MPNKRLRVIASILAVPLVLGAFAVVRAGARSPNGARYGDAASAASAGEQGSSASSGLSNLLAPSDGNGASFGTFKAAGTMSSSSSSWIRSVYPQQAAATQSSADPATMRWALLIGINDYQGSTESNVGSKQDAQSLYSYLRKLGWRSDHMILLVDLNATASHIIDSIRWLASKTNGSSTVIFHYAGHENWRRSSTESDGRDIGIWAADNRMIYEKTVGSELGRVNASRMWIDFATCRAAGFDEPGMVKNGRVLTFSSVKSELSYEDPDLHHSVFGWFVIVQGIVNKKADGNKDGTVTVEEAFRYAKNRVASYTSNHQHPTIIDKAGNFYFGIPKAPPKPAPSSSSGGPLPSAPPKTCVVLCV